MDVTKFIEYRRKIVESCSKVIIGKEDVISSVLICFICSGHVLLEDKPGTGKTMLLRAFAKTVGGDFKRIQFTPDLLPSDLTGINFYNQKTGEFEFRQGPLFSNIILADEINRATPRTQSALLESMEERQLSVDGKTYPLDEPFMVMATQNPIESYGTFPLPEAQVDRFFMRLSLGYMTRDEELFVLARRSTLDIVNTLTTVVTPEETADIKDSFHEVAVGGEVSAYLLDIVERTRRKNAAVAGVSTRGAIALYKAAQVEAAFSGRSYVIPEDIRRMAPSVLCHRLMPGVSAKSMDAVDFLRKILDETPVPLEKT